MALLTQPRHARKIVDRSTVLAIQLRDEQFRFEAS